MEEEGPTIQNQFQKLDIQLPRHHQENSRFWWLAGIALAVCFLAITLHYYVLFKKQAPATVYKSHTR